MMVSLEEANLDGDTEGRWPYDDGARDWIFSATTTEHLGLPEAKEPRKASPLETSEGA